MLTPTFPERPPRDPDEPTLAEALGRFGQGLAQSRDVVALSDLSRSDADTLAGTWPTVPDEARVAVARQMVELSEERLELNFGRACRVALHDASPVVRQLALAGLWEDERGDVIDILLDLLRNDESQDVRAEAAQGLARFAERAALGELDDEVAATLRRTLGAIVADPATPYMLRRRALESVGAFGSDAAVGRLIASAYASDDVGLRASAVYAMGQSVDAEWLPSVLEELESDEAELRYEAARASGALGEASAVPGLVELTGDEDVEVRYAAITALGKVGGRAALRVLQTLAEQVDEHDQDLVVAALEEATVSVDPLAAEG